MKSMFMVVLAAMFAVGLAGCGSQNHDADPVGTWTLSWDTDCDGNDGSRVYHFYDNETIVDASGNTGTWAVVDDAITMHFDYGGVWSGDIVADSTATGTYVNPEGGRGCWAGTKSSDIP